jgi:hypothetical protein
MPLARQQRWPLEMQPARLLAPPEKLAPVSARRSLGSPVHLGRRRQAAMEWSKERLESGDLAEKQRTSWLTSS